MLLCDLAIAWTGHISLPSVRQPDVCGPIGSESLPSLFIVKIHGSSDVSQVSPMPFHG